LQLELGRAYAADGAVLRRWRRCGARWRSMQDWQTPGAKLAAQLFAVGETLEGDSPTRATAT